MESDSKSSPLIAEATMTNQPSQTASAPACMPVAKSRGGAIGLMLGFFVGLSIVGAASMGYWLGSSKKSEGTNDPLELLHATATHSSSSMAVATGRIDQDSEGVFFLDYLTGDLQCWVFYPRAGTFGAKFTTNVTAQLPGGKNAEYILVTGAIAVPQAGGNSRLANSLVYVVDSRSGVFAAYGVPWNRSMENSSQPQMGQLISVGGGQIRVPGGGAIAAPLIDPKQANPPAGGNR